MLDWWNLIFNNNLNGALEHGISIIPMKDWLLTEKSRQPQVNRLSSIGKLLIQVWNQYQKYLAPLKLP